MNPELIFLYEKGICRQPKSFLAKRISLNIDPRLRCTHYYEGTCGNSFFCRQLVKKVVIGSFFPNLFEAKKWLCPGMAVYAKKIDGGLLIITDPFPFVGKPKNENGKTLIVRKSTTCSNCAHREAQKEINLCKNCAPLFGLEKEARQ